MRKSVSYLTGLKTDVAEALSELDFIATELANTTADLEAVPCCDLMQKSHNPNILALDDLSHKFAKQLKTFNLAVARYQNFF